MGKKEDLGLRFLGKMFSDKKAHAAPADSGEDSGKKLTDEQRKEAEKEALIRAQQKILEEEIRKRLEEEKKQKPTVSPAAPFWWLVKKRIGEEGVRRVKESYQRGKEKAFRPVKQPWMWARGTKEALGSGRERVVEVLRGGKEDESIGAVFIVMTIVLYFLDRLTGFDGISIQKFLDNLYFTSIESYVGWFFNSIVVTLLIAYYVIYRPKLDEFISWFLVAELLSVIIFLGGMGTMLVHLAFVIAFYFLYIRYSAGKDAKYGGYTTANYVFFVLVFFDFFGYGLLAHYINNPVVSNRLIIPIWFYFALIYTHQQKRTFGINLLIFIVILINVFYFVGGLQGLKNMSGVLTPEEQQEGANFWRTGFHNVMDTFEKVFESFNDFLDSQIVYATGGYYKGKVEKNKIGPLGVFIEKLQTSQPRYYEDEEVVIWGTIKAKSLEDSVKIEVECHKEGEEPTDKIEVTPSGKVEVYNLEARDFECRFPAKETSWLFDLGINTITVDVKFEFSTLAYLKTYFMDLERKRSMIREGLDPFKEFGIKDTNPIAVYTDGPVRIGMETTSPLIEVGKAQDGGGVITSPRLGVTLENKEGWEGVIREVKELIILTPKGVEIANPGKYCSIGFKQYSEEDCKKSCDDDNKDKCEKECEVLFAGGYTGYALDMANVKNMNKFKDIDRYRSFSCRLSLNTEVLGNTPLTVRYFRAKAKYDYVLSKDIDVEVQSEKGSLPGSQKISVSGTIPATILRIAGELGVDAGYALAMASVESSFRHCCSEKEKNSGSSCERSDKTRCDFNQLITSGSSYGVMQLNKNEHCLWFSPYDEACENGGMPDTCTNSNKDYDCDIYKAANCNPGESAKNLECNIRIGLAYLKKLKEEYGDGCRESAAYREFETFRKKCDSCCAVWSPYNELLPRECEKYYHDYTGWDAALRGYVGWACTDTSYVEKVNEEREKILKEGVTIQ
jgi:hypothetical protein